MDLIKINNQVKRSDGVTAFELKHPQLKPSYTPSSPCHKEVLPSTHSCFFPEVRPSQQKPLTLSGYSPNSTVGCSAVFSLFKPCVDQQNTTTLIHCQ